MPSGKYVERQVTSISALGREELKRRIRNFRGRFKLDFTEDYLNKMMENFADGNDRVVGRHVVQLDHYPAGNLVVESKVPAGDGQVFVTVAIYMIEVDDTMWIITFRTGRKEFSSQQQIIEASANSFSIQR